MTAVATTVGMGTVAVVRGAVGEPVAAVTLSDSQFPVGLPVGPSPTASSVGRQSSASTKGLLTARIKRITQLPR